MPNPTQKRTLPNPKTHRIKPRLIITILLNRIFFGFINFSSKFYFVKNFALLNFGFSIIKNSNFASKMAFFILKFRFLFIFTGGYLRKDRLSGRQTICLISTSLELWSFELDNINFSEILLTPIWKVGFEVHHKFRLFSFLLLLLVCSMFCSHWGQIEKSPWE